MIYKNTDSGFFYLIRGEDVLFWSNGTRSWQLSLTYTKEHIESMPSFISTRLGTEHFS